MNTRLCLTLLLLSLSLFSCREHAIEGSGPAATEARTIQKAFNSIEIDAPVDANITIQAGSGNAVSLSGYANILKYIRTEVRDSTLHIFIPDDIEVDLRKNITAAISCPVLTDISIAGTGGARVSGDLVTPEFNVDLAGSGTVSIQSLQAERLNTDLSGATVFNVASGKVARAKYDLSGAGSIKAYGLESKRTICDISGTGKAEVFVTDALDASVNGVGMITFRGDPKVNGEVNGIGSIKREDGAPAKISARTDSDDDDSTDEN